MAGAETRTELRAVMLGPPGSGKGTQAAFVCERLGVPAISTGDMLRQAVAEGSPLGLRVKEILDSGALVDDTTMAEVIERRLAAADADAGFLLDGYPRTLGQVETLDGILERRAQALDMVILIDVPEEELVKRILARKRADDTREVVSNRLAVYRDQTSPLIDHYRSRGLLEVIDGNQTIDEVQAAIKNLLEVQA